LLITIGAAAAAKAARDASNHTHWHQHREEMSHAATEDRDEGLETQ
jgi:hypothetical protein